MPLENLAIVHSACEHAQVAPRLTGLGDVADVADAHGGVL